MNLKRTSYSMTISRCHTRKFSILCEARFHWSRLTLLLPLQELGIIHSSGRTPHFDDIWAHGDEKRCWPPRFGSTEENAENCGSMYVLVIVSL